MAENTTDEMGALENIGRFAARGFVIAGGVFWMCAAFFGPYAFQDMSLTESLATAAWPFLATVITLGVGWVYERLAAVLLFAATAAVLVWGSMYQWELGVWILMAFVLVAPMLIAGILFTVAAHAERRRVQPPAARPTIPAPKERAVRTPAKPRVQPNIH